MNNLNAKNITKLFLKLYPVQVFIVISSSLSSLINGLIIGNNFDASCMSALGFIIPVISIITAIDAIISNGAGVLCGRLMGKGEVKKLNNVFSTSISLLFIIGMIFTIICLTLSSPIALLCGADETCLINTISYLRGIAIGIIPMIIIPCMMVFLQMYNESSFSLFSTIIMAIFNFLLSVANIKIFNGGIFGIGLASSLSQYLVLLVIILFILKKKYLSYKIKDFDSLLIKDITIFGFAGALGNILYSLRNATINNIASTSFGPSAVNALAILTSYATFFDSINIGLANAFGMLASVYIGEKDSSSLRILFKQATIIVFSIDIARIILIAFGANFIVSLFGASGEVIKLSKYLSIFYAFASPLNVIGAELLSTYNALGRIKYTPFLNLITAFVAPIFSIIVLCRFFGVNGIWLCYLSAEVIILLVLTLISIIKNHKIPTSFIEYVWLDKDFESKDKLSISINSMEEVINVSKQVEEYLKTLKIDSRRSQYAGLCIEEMAGNIVEHGFTKDKKKHTIDIFVCTDNDDISIRIKDDCVAFDPNTRNSIFNSNDPCKNVGIRLVSKLSKTMNYQTTFGMNILTIYL